MFIWLLIRGKCVMFSGQISVSVHPDTLSRWGRRMHISLLVCRVFWSRMGVGLSSAPLNLLREWCGLLCFSQLAQQPCQLISHFPTNLHPWNRHHLADVLWFIFYLMTFTLEYLFPCLWSIQICSFPFS